MVYAPRNPFLENPGEACDFGSVVVGSDGGRGSEKDRKRAKKAKKGGSGMSRAQIIAR